jgi:peroxiredoxin-like protein
MIILTKLSYRKVLNKGRTLNVGNHPMHCLDNKMYRIFNGGMLDMDNVKTKVKAVWNGGIMGTGSLKGENVDTQIAISKSSGGNGNGAEPQELLVCSATTCYIETLTYMLESRKLPVVELMINSEATVSEDGFHIIHYPKIILDTNATEELIQSTYRVIEGADRGCKVGNLLRKAGIIINIEGKVTIQ